MKTRILTVTSSLAGADGASNRLIGQLLTQLQRNYGEVEIHRRDLSADTTPHLTPNTVAAMQTAPEKRTTAQETSLELASILTRELLETDVLILAAPMYNFSVPSTLKAWLDHVAWAGVTFRYTASGPEGLVKGKKVYIVATRGGVYRNTDADTEIPYLRQVLSFLGLTDIHIIYAEGLATQHAEQGFDMAQAQIAAITEDRAHATA